MNRESYMRKLKDYTILVDIEKPYDWPANNREARLETINSMISEFIEDPSYKNKEILTSLITQSEINESNNLGLHRITEFEIITINSLFLLAIHLSFTNLKVYLYKHVEEFTRQQKMASMIFGKIDMDIPNIEKLHFSLLIFHISYTNYILNRDKTFISYLLIVVKESKKNQTPEKLFYLTRDFISLVNDLSYFPSIKTYSFLKWSRIEIQKMLELISELIQDTNQNPNIRPLQGVLCTLISNWALKSRMDYNENYLYKSLPDNAVASAFENHEVWMQKIEFLNDKREGKLIREIYKNKSWIKYDWAKSVDLEYKGGTYVSSFTKNKPSNRMSKEYGNNVFGYKSDKMLSILSPVAIHEKYGLVFGQTYGYDVIYGQKDAKNEINFLCDLINCLHIVDSEKNIFFNEIVRYFILSFKDKKWQQESERRFVVELYNNMKYLESNFSDRFFMLKSTALLFPDFSLPGNIKQVEIKNNILERNQALSTKSYIFCNSCLQSNYDLLHIYEKDITKCNICGSTDLLLVE